MVALLTLIAGAAGAVLVELARSPSQSEDPGPIESPPHAEAAGDPALEGIEQPRVGIQLEGRWVSGRVVDAVFGTPVGATLSSHAQAFGFSDPETGEFQFSETQASGQVTIEAAGYESCELMPRASLQGGDAGREVELAPRRSISVEIHDGSGAGLAGIRVQVATNLPGEPRHDVEARTQGVTDADGRWTCRTAVPVQLDVLDSAKRVLHSAFAWPGDTVTVVLGQRSFQLILEDDLAATPLPDVAVMHRPPDQMNVAQVQQRTDGQGKVELHSVSLPLIVQVGQGEFSVSDQLPTGTQWISNSKVLVSDLPRAGSVTLRLKRAGVFVQLREAASGEPIEGPVLANSLFECPDGSWPSRPLSNPVRIKDGLFFLSEKGVSVSAPQHPPFVVAAQGYAPERILLEELDLSLATRPSLVLDLVPSDSRLSIRLLDREGDPVRSCFRVLEYICDSPWFSYEGNSDEAGWLGPFDWQGGDLEVQSCMGIVVTTLVAESLDPSSPPTVRVSDVRGSILVHDVADPAVRILALAKSGAVHHGRWTEAGELEFLDLPAGEYLLGPSRWIRALKTSWREMGSDLGFAVRRGRRTSIAWNRKWSLAEALGGRVSCNCSTSGDLHLVPVYLDKTCGVPISTGGGQAVLLSRRGEYTLEAGQPCPQSLLVCAPDHRSGSGGWRALGQLEPGQSLELKHAEVRLLWTGEVAKSLASVSYRIDPDDLGIEARLASQTSHTMWDTTVPLHLRHIPQGVRELSVRIGGADVQVHAVQLPPPSTDLVAIEVGG